MVTYHLDLGCGAIPRNPYNRERLVGVDIREEDSLRIDQQSFEYRQCNFVVDPLPFPDNFFDSVSAFDVIEHIPRQLHLADRGLIYPFIEVMNEIHRVLKPGGLFLASIPGYPRSEAFQDPTHVNFISTKTAEYFSGNPPMAAMYGFHGNFKILINKFSYRKFYFRQEDRKKLTFLRRLHRRFFKSGPPHIIWEFVAIK